MRRLAILIVGLSLLYSIHQVFITCAPAEGGMLWGNAALLNHELVMMRRAYALEGWVQVAILYWLIWGGWE